MTDLQVSDDEIKQYIEILKTSLTKHGLAIVLTTDVERLDRVKLLVEELNDAGYDDNAHSPILSALRKALR